MCGISGIVANSVSRYRSSQQKMLQAQVHRGPDGSGIHFFDDCSLGHNRLSIIDLSTGDQPMLSADGSLAIVFNGEIYGYQEIKRSLVYDFKTTSDTEVILALYQKYGRDLFRHLPGMFSLAIWDDNKKLLLAGRDRFGEKPFFYSYTEDGEFVFASEIKALLASGLVKSDISRPSLARFLSHGYTGPNSTIYESIKQVPPAHFLVLEQGSISLERYWELPETSTSHTSIADAAETFSSLFEQAVRRQMVADVEVSAFLSGGLDSSTVVSVASTIHPKLKTLAFGYEGEESELPYAREAATLYGTDHFELFEQHIDIEDLYLYVSTLFDEPFSDSSSLATYLICKQASRYGKVVLTGDGGDELLGGYAWWYNPIAEALQAKDQSVLKHAFVQIMAVQEKIGELVGINERTTRTWRQRYLAVKAGKTNRTPLDMVQDRFSTLSRREMSLLQIENEESFLPNWLPDNSLNDAMKFDIVDYMPGDILVKTDRCAMRNSLELRAPFLDVDLATFCIAQPPSYKVASAGDKLLLREAFGSKWPASVRNRSKQGFGLKSSRWLDSPKMKEIKQELLFSRQSKLYELFPYEGVLELLGKSPGRQNSFLSLAIWLNAR